MSSLHGLPPLPKSLSGFSLLDGQGKPPTPVRTSSMRQTNPPLYSPHSKMNGETGMKSTNLDSQLAILRREMVSFTSETKCQYPFKTLKLLCGSPTRIKAVSKFLIPSLIFVFENLKNNM